MVQVAGFGKGLNARMRQVEAPQRQRTSVMGYTPQEIRKGLRHCFIAWIFGSAFFAIVGGAAFTSFLTKYLKINDATYGLIMAAGSVGAIFQVLGSYVMERTGRTKRMFLIYITLHRLLWLGVAAVPLFLPVQPGVPTTWQVVLVTFFVFISAIAANYGGAGWTAWMSGMVPKSIAGTFFGNRARAGMFVMVVTALAVSYLLDQFTGAGWIYTVIFGVAAVLGAMDIIMFIPVREIPRPVEADPPALLDIIATPWRNRLFTRFALYTLVTWFAYAMMGTFLWRYCYEKPAAQGLDLNVSEANLLLFIIPVVVMAVVAPFWGRAIDRFGPKPVLAVSSLCHAIIPIGWLLMRPDWIWLIPVLSVLGGLTWPGVEQVGFYVQLKGFPEQRRTTYIAMYLLVFGLTALAGNTLGGYYATFWQHNLHHIGGLPSWVSHYHPLFLTSILIRFAAFFFLMPGLPLDGAAKHKTVARSLFCEAVSSLQKPVRKRRIAQKKPTTSDNIE